jgi:hypothetical protein
MISDGMNTILIKIRDDEDYSELMERLDIFLNWLDIKHDIFLDESKPSWM